MVQASVQVALLQADGNIECVDVPNETSDPKGNLIRTVLPRLIGCTYLDHTHRICRGFCFDFWVDDSSLLDGKPLNKLATVLTGGRPLLYGTVALTRRKCRNEAEFIESECEDIGLDASGSQEDLARALINKYCVEFQYGDVVQRALIREI